MQYNGNVDLTEELAAHEKDEERAKDTDQSALPGKEFDEDAFVARRVAREADSDRYPKPDKGDWYSIEKAKRIAEEFIDEKKKISGYLVLRDGNGNWNAYPEEWDYPRSADVAEHVAAELGTWYRSHERKHGTAVEKAPDSYRYRVSIVEVNPAYQLRIWSNGNVAEERNYEPKPDEFEKEFPGPDENRPEPQLDEFGSRTVRAKRDVGSVTQATEDGLWLVTNRDGEVYHVSLDEGTCDCLDHEYRDAKCKHIRAVEMADEAGDA